MVPGATEDDIAPALRGRLKALGVRAGRHALFVPALLKPRAMPMRARLWALRRGVAVPALPAPGLVSIAPPPDWPEGFAAAMGWVAAGPLLVRLDVAERIAAELDFAARVRPAPVPADLASPPVSAARDRAGGAARAWLSADPGGRPGGRAVRPADAGHGGTAAPPPPAAPPKRRPPQADHPFAALAALRG